MPIRAFLVSKHFRFTVEAGTSRRTRSVTLSPYPSIPTIFRGLLVLRRNAGEAEVGQDLRSNAVMAKIGAISQGFIRFNRVHPSVLKRVRSQLVLQTDPSALLVHVKNDSLLFLGDSPQGSLQLCAAVTP
jgi:hypothetical protein